jgi:putative PIN family toxin of toxin-antitoxin system
VRVVIDTNVLISAIFWTGKPKQILNKVRQEEITFLTSEALLEELKTVLGREDKPFKLSEEEAEHIVTAMRDLAEVANMCSHVSACHDQKDNRVLECAIDGNADFIITGDFHLLQLSSFQKIRILTVADFLTHLKGSNDSKSTHR